MKKGVVSMAIVFNTGIALAQPGWHHKDLAADSVFGVSTEKSV